jgi:hypothetical protein
MILGRSGKAHILFSSAISFSLSFYCAQSAVASEALRVEAIEMKKQILQNCNQCHVGSGEQVKKLGDFTRTDVLRGLVNLKNFKSSKLYTEVAAGNMPQSDFGDFLDEKGRSTFLTAVENWVKAGAPNLELRAATLRTFAEVLQIAEKDFNRSKDRTTRYITFAAVQSAGGKVEAVPAAIAALSLSINHVSRNPILTPVQAVDKGLGLYKIRLSDYDIKASAWDQMAAEYPYRDEPEQSEATNIAFRNLSKTLGTRLPVVRAEWLINVITQPPHYNNLLGLPNTLSALERQLGIDTLKEIRAGNVLRSGFNQSGVSFNNRIIERFTTRTGYLWRSYDFKANVGRRNIFDFPVAPDDTLASSLREFVFQPDGGEMIFSLPNGLQGYFITNQNGGFLNPAPIDVVTDPARFDRQVTNGVSCMRCHGETGIIPKADQVFVHFEEAAKRNPRFQDEKLAESLRSTYGREAELKAWVAADQGRFVSALSKLGIEKEDRLALQKSIDRYLQPIGVQDLKLELMVPDDVWDRLSESNGALHRLRTQASKSLLKRDFLETEHRSIMREIRDFNRDLERGTAVSPNVQPPQKRAERRDPVQLATTIVAFGRGLTGTEREADVVANATAACLPKRFKGFVGACKGKPALVSATAVGSTLEITCQAQCQ